VGTGHQAALDAFGRRDLHEEEIARGILALEVIDEVLCVSGNLLVIRIGEPVEATGIVLSHGEELLFHKPHGFGIVVTEEPDQGLCVGNH
jgi:hypothetical protein